MEEITLDQNQIMQTENGRIAQDLAETIRRVAKTGVWEEVEDENDGIDPEKIIRKTMASYMGGSVPGWFLEAVQATSYVLTVDRMAGYGCVVALHEAAGRAPVEKRMAALTKLLAICGNTGLFSGLGCLPVA